MAGNTTTRVYELQVKLAQESLRALKNLEKTASDASKKLNALEEGFKGLAQGIAAGLTVDAVISSVMSAIDHVDQLATSAERLGVSVESFSALAFAAEQSDIALGELETGVKSLQKSMIDLGSKGNNVLEALGVDSSQDVEAVMADFADAFQQIKDPVAQTNALLAVFGKSGNALRPLLNQGSQGIEELTQKAKDLGLVISEDTAGALGDLDNAMLQVSAQSQALWVNLAEGLAPSLLNIVSAFEDGASAGEEFNAAGKIIGKTMEGLAIAAAAVGSAFQITGRSIGAVVAIAAQLAEGDLAGAWETAENAVADAGAEMENLYDTSVEIATGNERLAESTAEVNKETGEQKDLTEAVVSSLNKQASAAKEVVSAYEKRAQQLDKELASMALREEAESAHAKLLIDIEAGTLRVTAAEQASLEVKAKSIDALATQIEKENELKTKQEEGEALRLSLRTDMEVLQDKFVEYNDLLAQGAISQETYNRAVWDSSEAYTKAQEAASKSKDELSGMDAIAEELGSKIDGYGKELSGALVDFALNTDDASSSFSDFAESVLRNVAEMVTQMLIMEPLMRNIKASISGASSAGGIGGFFSSLFGSAKGNVFNMGAPMAFANGGLVTEPTVFPMANGGVGLMGEAGTEAIMPLQRDAQGRLGVSAEGGGGSGVVVNVYNNRADTDVKVEEQKGPNGEQVVNVMVEKAVDNAFAKGRFDSTLQAVYGITRKGRS